MARAPGSREAPAVQRQPRRFRSLRVVAEVTEGGGYPKTRDVYLLSSPHPPGFHSIESSDVDMCQFGLSCARVVDLILFALKSGIVVVYEPQANMRGWFSLRRQDEQLLFDPTDPE